MNLYEIDKSIMELIDYETGEVLDWDKLDELQAAKADKYLTDLEKAVFGMHEEKAEEPTEDNF